MLVGLTALAVTILIGPELSRAGSGAIGGSGSDHRLVREHAGAAGALVIRIAVDSAGDGSFLASGAISDAGPADVRRSVKGGRVRLTGTLAGSYGTLVIRVDQTCAKKASTWRIVRGSGTYAGLSGGGRGTGGVPCTGSRKSFRGIYRGTVRTSPREPYAAPGAYGGWTEQNERVTLEVLPGGRRLGNVRIERLYTTCNPPLDVVVEPAFVADYPIAADGSFSITFGSSMITGRFSGASASGVVTYASETGPYVCSSGSVAWVASTPPPPLPAALPGNYCGSTAQALGICLTLTPGGRITYLRVEARLDCVLAFVDGERVPPEQAQFEVAMGFGGGRVPLRSNLAFAVPGSLEGDAGGEYVLRGTFETTGTVSGTLSLHRTSLDDQEGRLYTCKDAVHGWRATRVP